MRAHEFLIEYNKNITNQRYGEKILRRAIMDQGRDVRLADKLAPEQKDSVVNSILSELEAADPTSNKQYMQWIVKMYCENQYGSGIEDLASTGRDALEKFHKLKIHRQLQSPRNDIMRYTTVGDFVNVMDEYPDPEALAVQANKGHAEEILNNEQVRIVVPLDEAASKYYGQGTRWCTASINNNMFDSYNRDGPLYILIPKNPLHQGEKYQIHFAEYQFMDETDQPVDPYNLLTKRFGNLFHFFVERHPEIQETILFADSQLLQRLLDKISDAGMEPVYEILSNWQEADYSGYYQWLEYMGYVYPEDHPEAGMIDWDKVDDAGVDFTDYSDEASNFLSTAEFALKVTIPQIRELAVGDESHIPLLPHLPALVARHVDGVASYGSRAFRGHLWEVAELLKSRVVVMAKKSSGPTAEPEWNVYITRYDKGHEKRFDLVQ